METQTDDLVIDASNFGEYFFDARKHGPKAGQVLAKFTAIAVLCDGPDKRDLMKALRRDKAESAATVMRKFYMAREPDCYRVCREICEDLLSGMSFEDVAAKEYEFVLEAIYYARPEHVPSDDPRWTRLDVLTYDTEAGCYRVSMSLPSAN